MKKGYLITLVALSTALIAAVAAVIVLWCSWPAKVDEHVESGDQSKSELLTEAYLYNEWQSDDYLIFEDGTVISRKTFEKVYKLDLSRIAYTDGALCINGSFVAVHTDENTLKVYDLSKGEEVYTLNVNWPWDEPVEMSLSSCGRYLLYKHENDMAGIYDLSTGEMLRELEVYYLNYVGFSDVGRYIYVVDYEDAHSGVVMAYSMDDPSADVMMDFGGRLCPIDNGGHFIVDIENDTVLDMASGTWLHVEIDGYFEFSNDGRYLAVETPDNVVKVYDTQSWEVVSENSYVYHSGTIFIDNDKYMLTCHYPDEECQGNQTADVYDTETWTLVNTLRIDSWIEDLKNLKDTYVYDLVEGGVVDVLTSEKIVPPFYFDDVRLMDVNGSVLTMLLVTYDGWEPVTRVVVFDKYTGEYHVNTHLTPDSDIFISDNGEYLICNGFGAYKFTFEDFRQVTRFLSE